jgi:hypothetical protein
VIYLYAYFGIGIAVLFAMVISSQLERRDKSPLIREMLDALDPKRSKLSYRIMTDRVVPALAGVAVIVVWPAAVVMGVKKLLHERQESIVDEPEFSVQPQHLVERLTLRDVEARERIEDPLGAVPPEPFGHLHEAWTKLAAGIGEKDEIWTFSARGRSRLRRDESRSGYVIVRNGRPGAYFLTVLKDESP